jgi:type II secretory pathway pseudopilin PulG
MVLVMTVSLGYHINRAMQISASESRKENLTWKSQGYREHFEHAQSEYKKKQKQKQKTTENKKQNNNTENKNDDNTYTTKKPEGVPWCSQ